MYNIINFFMGKFINKYGSTCILNPLKNLYIYLCYNKIVK